MNAAVEDARLRRIAEQSLAEHKKQTQLLERIADTLDVVAMSQDTFMKMVEEQAEPPVVATGTIPGFPEDPLEGFPSIRKDEK